MPDFEAVSKPLEWFVPNDENYRGHSEPQVQVLRESLRAFGVYKNVVARPDGTVLAGHGVITAAKAEGLAELPVFIFEGTEEQARALLVADNEISRLAEDDPDQLSQLLASLQDDGMLALTGHDDESLAALLEEVAEQAPPTGFVPPEDEGPGEPPVVPVTQPGDVWLCGRHRVVCGDCTDAGAWDAALAGRNANVIFTSPPYAMQRKEQYGGVPADSYVEWFLGVAALAWSHLADDGSFFVNIKEHCEDGERHLYVKRLVLALHDVGGWKFIDEFCWRRPGYPGGWDTRFKNEFEPVFHFGRNVKVACYPLQVKEATHFTPVKGGKSASGSGFENSRFGDGETARPGNVLDIGAAGSTEGWDIAHPARFPVALPSWFCHAFAKPGYLITDPFMGSGTTMIAAEQSGRVACGTELLPAYCDVAVKRWQRLTGERATLESTGQPFPRETE